MRALFCQRHIRIDITLNIVHRAHMIGKRGTYFFVEDLPCMLIIALEVCIDIMVGFATIIGAVFLFHQQCCVVNGL